MWKVEGRGEQPAASQDEEEEEEKEEEEEEEEGEKEEDEDGDEEDKVGTKGVCVVWYSAEGGDVSGCPCLHEHLEVCPAPALFDSDKSISGIARGLSRRHTIHIVLHA